MSPEDRDSGPLDFGPGSDQTPAPGSREPPAPPPAAPRTSRYGWFIGVLIVLFFGYVTLNTLNNVGSGRRGTKPGRRLPAFAVPLATGDLQGDANVATGAHQGQRGARPACQVRDTRQILNVCQLGERGPLVLAFAATGDPSCNTALDRLQAVLRAFPGVQLAAVAAKTDRGGLRRLIVRHHWRFPVGLDRDGAVFSIYGVVSCPTVTFAYPGRIAMRTTVKRLDPPALTAIVRRLVKGSERRGWSPPS